MKLIPNALILEKNKLASAEPWLLLLRLTLTETPLAYLYLVRNTDNVVYDGQTYTAFPFEIGDFKQSNAGEIPSISLRVCNIMQSLQSEIEAYDGLVGRTVTFYLVHNAHLTDGTSYATLTWTFNITGCSVTWEWITFTLSAPNPLRRRFPLYRYMPNSCPWIFKSVECKYVGTGTCVKTLASCQAINNQINFGGHIGLGAGGMKIA